MAEEEKRVEEEKKVEEGKEEEKKEEKKERPRSPLTVEKLAEFIRGEITLQELHNVHPNEMLAIAKLGQVMFESGKLDEARTIFEGLVALNPYIGQFHSVLGSIYLKQGEFESAIEEYTKAIERNPNDIAAYANRGEIYLRMGKFEEASKDLYKAIELDKETDPKKKNPASMRAIVLAMALTETVKEFQKKLEEQKKKEEKSE